jgi:hypothetical protein
MTFTEHEEAFIWECNDCGKIAAFPFSNFYEKKGELKERGWSFRLDEETGYEGAGRSWSHYCAACARKRRKPVDLSQPFRTVRRSEA